MRIAAALALGLIALGAQGAEAQLLRDRGWWVVVESAPDLPPAQTDARHRAVATRLGRCGFSPFYDFSSKFSGFRPGLMVYVLGAYATRGEAEAARKTARACAPAAYLKQGRYAGE